MHRHKHTELPPWELTGGLEAFDVPGCLKEVASEEEEDEEEGKDGDKDPGDD